MSGSVSGAPGLSGRPRDTDGLHITARPDQEQIGSATGPLSGAAGNHGGMSPWTIRNTFIAWGPDFKRGVAVRTPVSNVDLAPTLVALMNLDTEIAPGGFDGGALREAFVEGPDEEQVPAEVRIHFVEPADGAFSGCDPSH